MLEMSRKDALIEARPVQGRVFFGSTIGSYVPISVRGSPRLRVPVGSPEESRHLVPAPADGRGFFIPLMAGRVSHYFIM